MNTHSVGVDMGAGKSQTQIRLKISPQSVSHNYELMSKPAMVGSSFASTRHRIIQMSWYV